MAKALGYVPWGKFLKYDWLVGAMIRTMESFLSQRVETEGVIIDVVESGQSVMFKVRGVDPPESYEIGGAMSMMNVSEFDDGSYRFEIPFLGTARISLT